MEQAVPAAEPSPELDLPSPPPLQDGMPAATAPAALAPWYHTLGIVLLLLTYAFVAHLTHRTPSDSSTVSGVEQRISDTARYLSDTPKIPLYCSTIMLSWMLLASVVAGLYHRRAFFRMELHRRFRSRWTDPAIGLAIYASFFCAVSTLVLLLTTFLLVRAHAAHPHAPNASSQTRSAPEDAADQTLAVQQRVRHILHFNQEAVASLEPRTLPQMLLWIVLSLTAGFCEEHIFRGYLLAQSMAAMRRLAISPWLASTISVLATSMLFGSLHLYEGVGGAVVITVLGAIFATMALLLGNLRAVIVAHFLQDILGGLVYYIAHLRHAL